MSRTQPIKIRSIDIAAIFQSVFGKEPELCFENGSAIATFIFKDDSLIRELLADYETGLELDAENLLKTRNQLFRRLKAVKS